LARRPVVWPREGGKADGSWSRAPSPLRPPAHLLGAEARQRLGLLEEPRPSPGGDEDVGQVEQEGRAEVGAVFPWGRRGRDRHGRALGAQCQQCRSPPAQHLPLCPRSGSPGANPWADRGMEAAWRDEEGLDVEPSPAPHPRTYQVPKEEDDDAHHQRAQPEETQVPVALSAEMSG